jgi:hypothetical protein
LIFKEGRRGSIVSKRPSRQKASTGRACLADVALLEDWRPPGVRAETTHHVQKYLRLPVFLGLLQLWL